MSLENGLCDFCGSPFEPEEHERPKWVDNPHGVAFVGCRNFKIEYDARGEITRVWVDPEEVAEKMGFARSRSSNDSPCA